MTKFDEPVSTVEDLLAFFEKAETPEAAWRVGTEHEKIGLSRERREPIPYEGDQGIRAVLEGVAHTDGWKSISEAANVVALEKDGASITLEPGGQLELSGAPLRTIHETCDEFNRHLALIKRVCEPLGIVWLGLGIHPFHAVDEIPLMPKERYRIMRRYLPTRGERGLVMMFQTATVQANFDYADEPDMVDKMRLALGITPIVSAIFANSSISDGDDNGFASKRIDAWDDTDPDRTGMLPFVFEEDFGYRRYIEWALDVPMFFVMRGDRYESNYDMTFRQFMRDGRGDLRATLADFDRHLTTLFPDVRLKNIIEVRGADAVPPGLTCSLPALWKGILYDASARAAAHGLVAAASHEDRLTARRDVARLGLAATFLSRPMGELAVELAEISRAGLRRIGHGGKRDSDETAYLDPVFEQLERGKSPGEVVRDCWLGEWKRNPDRLIEYAQY